MTNLSVAACAWSAVIASSGGLTSEQMRDLWFDLENSDVELIVYPSMFEMATRRVALETVADLPLLHVQRVRLTRGREIAAACGQLAAGERVSA